MQTMAHRTEHAPLSLGLDRRLVDRDPMVAHAFAAHLRDWRPELEAKVSLTRNDARGLPGVELSMLEHSIEWSDGDGRATFRQKWVDGSSRWWEKRESGWTATLHMRALPDTIAMALAGEPLSRVIDAPGAEHWMVSGAEVVGDTHTKLTLERRAQ